jgi:hypothetical protein
MLSFVAFFYLLTRNIFLARDDGDGAYVALAVRQTLLEVRATEGRA